MTDAATIEELALAADLPAVAAEQWRGLVQKVLKGADIERRLARTTADGIKVQPLYVAADAPVDPGMPGNTPYVRGASAAGSVAGGWDIRQLETVQDPALANAAILEALEGGATSIQLRLRTTPDANMLDRVLADVLLDLAPVGLDAKADFLAAAKALLQVAARRGIDAASFHADLNADPLGAMAGSAVLDPASGLADAAGLAGEVAAEWPGVVALLADGRPYHAGGASEGEELACAVATGIGYLRALVDAGLPAATAAGQIGFALATDTDFFLSLAKFRALRRLWGHVLDVAGASAAMPALRVHAETAERMLTWVDPHVNILRGTVAAFAAAAGGAGSITVLPFDHALGMPAPLARRIARNTQLVLLEEGQLGRVLDPAGGSWFVERLTEELAAKAWSLVQEIERRGGMLAALRQGWPQERVAASRKRLEVDIANRRQPVTGVSEFADLREPPGPILSPEPAFGGTPVVRPDPQLSPLRGLRAPAGAQRRNPGQDRRPAAHLPVHAGPPGRVRRPRRVRPQPLRGRRDRDGGRRRPALDRGSRPRLSRQRCPAGRDLLERRQLCCLGRGGGTRAQACPCGQGLSDGPAR